jgi:hypothetical protein
MNGRFAISGFVSLSILASAFVNVQGQGFGKGRGGRHGEGAGRHVESGKDDQVQAAGGPTLQRGGGPPGDREFPVDRSVFQFLLSNHDKIRREVKNLENGVETLTESDDPEVAAKIFEHALAMHKRVKTDRGIHMRDPLFAEIFRHTDKIEMAVGKTAKGVKVVETSEDPYVARLIQAHAQVVSRFATNGHGEVRKNHEVPARPEAAAAKPGEKESDKSGGDSATCGCKDRAAKEKCACQDQTPQKSPKAAPHDHDQKSEAKPSDR